MNRKIAKWCDEWKLAAIGIVLASKKAKFWVIFFIVFTIFGTLLSLLSAGSGAIDLFFASDFSGKITILGDAFLSLFGYKKTFLDWLLTFLMAFLQAILVSLIILIWRHRKQSEKSGKFGNSANVQNASIIAGLALLGSGCPTCGTTLIAPIIASIFSSGSFAIAGTISGLLNIAAYIILLLSLKKVGLESYAIIKSEHWQKKRSVDGKNH